MEEGDQDQQQTLMSMLIHDARGPLSFLTLTLDAWGSGDADGRLLTTARAQLQQLNELLGDMMRLHEGTAPRGRRERLEVDRLVRLIAADIALAHPHLAVDVETAGATVSTDPVGVRRVVENLLRNAARHARARIWARVELDGANVRILVEDDGDGPSGITHEAMFDPRTRGHHSDGHGLGLAISRMIARSLEGDVVFSDGGPRTRFELRIPAHEGGSTQR